MGGACGERDWRWLERRRGVFGLCWRRLSVRAKKCCAVDLTRRGALLLRNGEGGVYSLVGGERGAWWGGRVGGRRRLDLRGVKGRRLAWTRRVAERDGGTGRGGRFLAMLVRCLPSVLTCGCLFRHGGVRFRRRQGREHRVE